MISAKVWQLSACGGCFFEGQGHCEEHGAAYFPTKKEALDFLKDWVHDPTEIGQKFELSSLLLKAEGLRQLLCACLDHEDFYTERELVMTGTVVEFQNGKIAVKWESAND